MNKQEINTSAAPQPRAGAPYSQAIVAGSFVFASGQLPIDPDLGHVVPGGVAEQTEQTLRNLEAVLIASGSGLEHLVKTTVFLSDARDWAAMNEVYGRHVGAVPPARSAITVPELSLGALVEIEAIGIRADGFAGDGRRAGL